MSLEKVQAYYKEQAKSAYRRGYPTIHDLLSGSGDTQSRVVSSVERVEVVIGIGTNNRFEGLNLTKRYLSNLEQLEKRAQEDFNRDYQKRIEELDRLRVAETLTKLTKTIDVEELQSVSSLHEFQKLQSSMDLPAGGFNFEEVGEEPVEDNLDDSILDDFLSSEDSSDEVAWTAQFEKDGW